MRTFEEVKSQIEYVNRMLLQRSVEKLENDKKERERPTLGGKHNRLSTIDKSVAELMIQECQNVLENLEEATRIEIGAATNGLIRLMQERYQEFPDLYFELFDDFLEKNITGMDREGNNVRYCAGVDLCMVLGVTNSELTCFKDSNPMNSEVGDYFRQMINKNFGTTIPMNGELEKASQDYEFYYSGEDEVMKDQTFIKLKELQRDAGTLKNGPGYFLLGINSEYQEVKAKCTGRNI